VKNIKTVQEAISHLKEVYSSIDNVYGGIAENEIKAVLDNIKSLINKTKYKLLFLE